MRSNARKVRHHCVLGIGFIVAVAAPGAQSSDGLPPPDRDPSAPLGPKRTLCHRAHDGRFSPLTTSASSVGAHLRHGDCLMDDSIPCTTDSCEPVRGCVHTPNDSRCNDGFFCTTEHCDLTAGCVDESTCQPFSDGCIIRNHSCDEDNDTCVDVANHVACDDGDACTVDDCNDGTGCVHSPVSCPSGQTCDPETGICDPSSCAETCAPEFCSLALDAGVACGCVGIGMAGLYAGVCFAHYLPCTSAFQCQPGSQVYNDCHNPAVFDQSTMLFLNNCP